MSKEKYEQIDDSGYWDQNFIWDKNNKYAQIRSWHAIKYDGKSPGNPRLLIYSSHNLLGEGTYGRVYAGKKYELDYKLRQITFKKEKAVKVAPFSPELQREFILSQKVKHLGVKAPVYIKFDNHEDILTYLPMNKIPGESLLDLIDKNTFNNYLKLELTYQLLIALRAQVTSIGIIHRDIKPPNILVSLSGLVPSVYIIDYGLSTEIGSQYDFPCGTLNYIAPELFEPNPHTPACDVHSMARTIIYLWTKGKLFHNEQRSMQQRSDIENFTNEQLSDLNDLPDDLVSLLKSMLEFDPDKRINIDQAIAQYELAFPSQNRVVDSLLIYLKKITIAAEHIQKHSVEDAEIVYDFVNQMMNVLKLEQDPLAIKDSLFALLQNDPIISCAKRHLLVDRVLKNTVIDCCDFLIDTNNIFDIEDYRAKGVLHWNNREWYQALYFFYQVLRLTTSNTWAALHNIAEVSQKLEWHDEAIRTYGKVLALNSNCVSAYQYRGASYFALGQYSKAIGDLSRAKKLNPTHKDIYYLMAAAYSHMNLYLEAINSYVRAIELGYEPCQLNFQWFFAVVKLLTTMEQITVLKQCLNPKNPLGCLYAKHEEERELLRSYWKELHPATPGATGFFFNANEQEAGISSDFNANEQEDGISSENQSTVSSADSECDWQITPGR